MKTTILAAMLISTLFAGCSAPGSKNLSQPIVYAPKVSASPYDVRECQRTLPERTAAYHRYMASEDYSWAAIELTRCAGVLNDSQLQQMVNVAETKDSLLKALSETATEGQRKYAVDYLQKNHPDTYNNLKDDIARIQVKAEELEREHEKVKLLKASEIQAASQTQSSSKQGGEKSRQRCRENSLNVDDLITCINVRLDQSRVERESVYEQYKGKKAHLTLARYYNIDTGMAYHEVVKTLGGFGQEISSNYMGGVPGVITSVRTVMYQWVGPGGANMNAMFQNDKLVSKAQFGLR